MKELKSRGRREVSAAELCSILLFLDSDISEEGGPSDIKKREKKRKLSGGEWESSRLHDGSGESLVCASLVHVRFIPHPSMAPVIVRTAQIGLMDHQKTKIKTTRDHDEHGEDEESKVTTPPLSPVGLAGPV